MSTTSLAMNPTAHPTDAATRKERASRQKTREIEQAQLQAGVEDDRALLRLAAVMALTGLSRSSVYARLARGQFVEPVRLSARCSRWRVGDVRAWLAAVGGEL